MIINCPIYLEVEQKFTPEEGREFTLGIRKLLRDHLAASTGGSLKIKTDKGQILTIKILSEKQAVDRFGAKVTKVDNQPPL
jgi:hypothetical protein